MTDSVNHPLEREICPNCGGYTVRSKHCDEWDCEDGWIDEHESDPINFSPGEEYTMCEECCGTGRVRWCSDCGCDITRHEWVRENKRRLFEDTEQ